jgi:hypothetical protein
LLAIRVPGRYTPILRLAGTIPQIPSWLAGDTPMDQKYEGNPRAEIRLVGRRVIRTEVVNDWGLRLQWEIRRDGKVIATPLARLDLSYEHPDKTPGTYEIVLQMWKYVDYRKGANGEFTNSKFVTISNKVTFKI